MPALATGTNLGPYRILGSLGAGGMGEVYRASDSRLARQVAVKVLPAEVSADPERLRRFEREARAAGALNHPGLLTIYEFGSHDGAPYLVSELLDGETLRDRLRRGAVPVGKAIDYAHQIADGLAAAHDKGIVHRDLKPENLFICKDDRIKILDFGLAKLTHPEPASGAEAVTESVTNNTTTGAVLGTVGYMAPEQVRGEPVDARADLFNFAVVLYEMLAGRRAFERKTSIETLNAILNEEPAPLDVGLPPVLRQLVQRCLAKDPQRRFQSARDVAIVLEDLNVFTAEPGERDSGWGRGRRRALALGLAGTMVLAIGLVAYFAGRDRARVSAPEFHRLTYRRGSVGAARFGPDGRTIVYSAAWDGAQLELFTTLGDRPESRPLLLGRAELFSVSSQGELAIAERPVPGFFMPVGTLARVPLAGGGVRELVDKVDFADWTPDGKELAIVRSPQAAPNSAVARARLELPAGRVLYEMAGWISHPRVSPDGRLVAFIGHRSTSSDGGFVGVVDRNSHMRVLADGYGSAYGLAWHPAGREVWFTASKSGSHRALFAVTLSGKQRLVERVPGSVTLHDIAADGRVLMTSETAKGAIKAMGPGATQERDITLFDWPNVDAMSLDGRSVLFHESGEGVGQEGGLFIRDTAGGPAVRLGNQVGLALSPDRKWALVQSAGAPSDRVRYELLPTGAGEARSLDLGAIETIASACWQPDGQRLFFTAHERGMPDRVYVQDLETGRQRAITPEGVKGDWLTLVSPDGRVVAGLDSLRQVWLYPIDSGSPRRVPATLATGESLICFASDGRALFMNRWHDDAGLPELPQKIYRLELGTGRRILWRTLILSDPAGVTNIGLPRLTPDGKSYVYQYMRFLSELQLVDGLK